MMYVEKKHAKSAWISSSSTTIEKPWGYETSWSGFSGVHGKTLFIRKGERTSFKYNKSKTEVLIVLGLTVRFIVRSPDVITNL